MASDLIIKNNENSLANLLSFLRNQCLKLHKNTRLAHDQLLRVTQKKTLLWKFQFKFEVFDEYFLKLHRKWNKNYNVNMLTGKKTCIWFSLARSIFEKKIVHTTWKLTIELFWQSLEVHLPLINNRRIQSYSKGFVQPGKSKKHHPQ